MNSSYVIYELSTGRIVKTGVCSEDIVHLQLNNPETEGFLIGIANENEHYIVNGLISLRPNLSEIISIEKYSIDSNGIDSSKIMDIPEEISQIYINDQSYTLGSSGQIEFTSSSPGIYKLKIDQFPYLPWEIDIEVLE